MLLKGYHFCYFLIVYPRVRQFSEVMLCLYYGILEKQNCEGVFSQVILVRASVLENKILMGYWVPDLNGF